MSNHLFSAGRRQLLACDEARYQTGILLPVDGGLPCQRG